MLMQLIQGLFQIFKVFLHLLFLTHSRPGFLFLQKKNRLFNQLNQEKQNSKKHLSNLILSFSDLYFFFNLNLTNLFRILLFFLQIFIILVQIKQNLNQKLNSLHLNFQKFNLAHDRSFECLVLVQTMINNFYHAILTIFSQFLVQLILKNLNFKNLYSF